MTSKVTYLGNLRSECIHMRSGSTIETDAPVDNKGKGERFSPTDLVATALASCIVTTMGIVADNHEMNIDGTECEVEKIMEANPRRIGEIRVDITFPANQIYNDRQRAMLEHAANTCPVHRSLSDDCKRTLIFNWPLQDFGV